MADRAYTVSSRDHGLLIAVAPIERVVFMKGAQIGGTECGNNWIGLRNSPGARPDDGGSADRGNGEAQL